MFGSEEEGEHGLAILGVLIFELFLVSPVFVLGPNGHLHNGKDGEQVGCVIAGQKGEGEPS